MRELRHCAYFVGGQLAWGALIAVCTAYVNVGMPGYSRVGSLRGGFLYGIAFGLSFGLPVFGAYMYRGQIRRVFYRVLRPIAFYMGMAMAGSAGYIAACIYHDNLDITTCVGFIVICLAMYVALIGTVLDQPDERVIDCCYRPRDEGKDRWPPSGPPGGDDYWPPTTRVPSPPEGPLPTLCAAAQMEDTVAPGS